MAQLGGKKQAEDVPTEPPESPPDSGLEDNGEEVNRKFLLQVYLAMTGERIAELRLKPSVLVKEMSGVVAIAAERSRRAAFPCLPLLKHDEEELNMQETLEDAGLYDGATIIADMYPAIVTASTDKTAKVWNADSGICEKTLQGHSGCVHYACFGPDGRFLATCSDDNTAKVWMSATGQVWRTLVGHTDSVFHIAFSSDGKLVATASGDHTARIWGVKNGTCLQVLEGHTAPVFSVSFTQDCRSVITASRDFTLKEWSVKTGILDRTMPKAQDPAYASSFSPCGCYTVTAQGEWTAKIVDVDTNALKLVLEGHTGIVVAASYAPPACPLINQNAKAGAKQPKRPPNVIVGIPGAKKGFGASWRQQKRASGGGSTGKKSLGNTATIAAH